MQGKLEFDYHDSDQMEKLVFRYIEGASVGYALLLQWLFASWSWFYDYHYASCIW